jgi:hypothetical protein
MITEAIVRASYLGVRHGKLVVKFYRDCRKMRSRDYHSKIEETRIFFLTWQHQMVIMATLASRIRVQFEHLEAGDDEAIASGG